MAYKITTVSNIPIYADWSLLLLLLLLISNFGNPVLGVAVGLGLALSITLHELGHSLVAQAFGCKVRDITLMMLGGCATIINMPRKAWQEFLMAAAGPLVSLLLGIGLFFTSIKLRIDPLGASIGSHYNPGVFYILGSINIGLFIFNLLPAFPMDGGRILRALLQHFFMTRLRATWVASRIGRLLAILMGLSVVYSILSGQFQSFMMIRLLIAFYIFRAAGNEYHMVLLETHREQTHTPFGGSAFWGAPASAPPDDGQAIVSPPPYERGNGARIDVQRD